MAPIFLAAVVLLYSSMAKAIPDVTLHAEHEHRKLFLEMEFSLMIHEKRMKLDEKKREKMWKRVQAMR